MPSFNGVTLGAAVNMHTPAAPVDIDIIAFPGVNGIGINVNGSRGGMTYAEGPCYDPTPAGLATVLQTFRAMQAAATEGVLVDSFGTSWPNVTILEFDPYGDVIGSPESGYACEARWAFLHQI